MVVLRGKAHLPDSHPIETPQEPFTHHGREDAPSRSRSFSCHTTLSIGGSPPYPARIGSVILRGYYRQTIRGLGQTVPVSFASTEDDNWDDLFPRTLVTSRDGLIDFKSLCARDGSRTRDGPEPPHRRFDRDRRKDDAGVSGSIEVPITQPVVFRSESESSARFRGRNMISPDRLTVGYGMSGASTEKASPRCRTAAEDGTPNSSYMPAPTTRSRSWTNVGIRSTGQRVRRTDFTWRYELATE